MSYYVIVQAAKGHLLLGGVPRYVSSLFEKREHAERLGEVLREGNEACKYPPRKVESVTIVESKKAPRILAREIEP